MIAGEGIFKNPGPQLKSIAVWSYYIEMAASCIGAVYYFMEEVDLKHLEFESILICLAILVGGIAGALVVSLFLYGVGEAMEHIAAIKENSQALREDVHRLVEKDSASSGESRTEAFAVNRNGEKSHADIITTSPAVAADAPEAAPVVTPRTTGEDDQIECPACGKLQRANRTVCWGCGAKFMLT